MTSEQGTGVERIAAERARQDSRWGASHDAEHIGAELAAAGAWYALPWLTRTLLREHWRPPIWPSSWDFNGASREPPSLPARIRELEKAGALIAAEIDRLQELEV